MTVPVVGPPQPANSAEPAAAPEPANASPSLVTSAPTSAPISSSAAVTVARAVTAEPNQTTPGFRGALELVGLVAAPTTILTALLYYFGWVRTRAFFGSFGVDQSTLQWSTADYLLRSAEVAFRPFAALLVVLAGWTWLQATFCLDDMRGKPSWATRGARAALPWCAAALIAVPVVDLLVVPLRFLPPFAAAVLLGIGALLADLALRHRLRRSALHDSRADRGGPGWAARMTLAATVFLAAFWSIAVYADASGRALARDIAARPASRPGVILYCRQRPQISGRGVTATTLTGRDNQYRYRYDGLVLLLHNGATWLLLPVAWADGDPIIRLSDDPSCRLDFRPPA